jgi:co-chaperonin GroES (HSP10)
MSLFSDKGYSEGVDIPPEVAKLNAIYDMVLVERFSEPEKLSSGLFLPKTEGRDKKSLGKVLSVPVGHGLESEIGRVQPLSEIAPCKVGDVVFLQDAWGIGPMDIVVRERCFSFHKSAHVLAKMVQK